MRRTNRHVAWVATRTGPWFFGRAQWWSITKIFTAVAVLKLADADAVLISKALKAAKKNRALVTEYLAKGASERFFELARKHRVDLEQFV